jgi:hypothetical protein
MSKILGMTTMKYRELADACPECGYKIDAEPPQHGEPK